MWRGSAGWMVDRVPRPQVRQVHLDGGKLGAQRVDGALQTCERGPHAENGQDSRAQKRSDLLEGVGVDHGFARDRSGGQ